MSRGRTLRERAPGEIQDFLALVEEIEGPAAAEKAFACWLDTLEGAVWCVTDAAAECWEALREALGFRR